MHYRVVVFLACAGCGGSTAAVTFGPVIDAVSREALLASVCRVDGEECVEADTSGFTLELPRDEALALQVTADGHRDAYVPIGPLTGDFDVPNQLMLDDAVVGTMLSAAGVAETSGTALVLVMVGSTAGVTAALSPASGDGPFYTDTNGLPNPSLDATTTAGGVTFANVAPGDVTVTASGCGFDLGGDDLVTDPTAPAVSGGTTWFAWGVCP